MKVELNDVLERLAFILAKQSHWEGIKAVHDSIAAVENLEFQDPLEVARQNLRSTHIHKTECP